MADEPAILVAVPERFGLPLVPSDKRRCDRCTGAVWVSHRGDDWRGSVLCLTCAMAVLKPSDVIGSAPWILEDLAELAGE